MKKILLTVLFLVPLPLNSYTLRNENNEFQTLLNKQELRIASVQSSQTGLTIIEVDASSPESNSHPS